MISYFMIRHFTCALMAIAVGAFAVRHLHAQTPVQGGDAAVVSPQLNADHTITLRFLAPNAKSVIVIGELDGKDHPMTRDSNGVWTATIGPLPPDVSNYQFNADGVITTDPLNPWVKGSFGRAVRGSLVEVHGDGPGFDDAKPVQHGRVSVETVSPGALAVREAWDLHTA